MLRVRVVLLNVMNFTEIMSAPPPDAEEKSLVTTAHPESNADSDKQRWASVEGGLKCVGRKFLEYYNGPDNAAKNIPSVEVKFKVRRLSDFDSKSGTFYADVLLMLDWEDPSLALSDNSPDPDFNEHFWPQAEFQNASPASGEAPDWSKAKPKYKPDRDDPNKPIHRATITILYKMVLFARCDFREYPFDRQALELTIKLLSVNIPCLPGDGVRPVAKHPKRFRKHHQLIKECDCLPEYDFVRLAARSYSSKYGPFVNVNDRQQFENDKKNGKLFQDEYTLQIILVRDSVSVLLNMCFSLFVIDVMLFAAHCIPMGDLADRMSVNLTLLLTAMAFKWVLADQLPPVPYLTTIEKYVIMTFFCLWLQGITFWFLADFYNYRCNKDELMGDGVITNWWTGDVEVKNTTLTADTSCQVLQVFDRFVMFVEFLALILKNLWFYNRYQLNRKEKVLSSTNFVNLGGIREFCMQKDLEWSPKGAFTEQMEGCPEFSEEAGTHHKKSTIVTPTGP